jgi:signal transduction histidine kinase/DNA-binding NarL/FixJ family response regulator
MSFDGRVLLVSTAVLLGLAVAIGLLFFTRLRRLQAAAGDTQRRLDESEQRYRSLVETVASDVTHLKRAEAQLRAEKRLSEDLVAVARATSEGADLQDTLRNTLSIANTLTGASGSSLLLVDEGGAVTGVISTRGEFTAADPGSAQRVMSEGLAGWAARTRQSVLVDDLSRDPRWLALPVVGPPLGSALVVPISSGATVVGALTLYSPENAHFVEDHRRLMEAAASQIALALRNAQVSEARLHAADREALLRTLLEEVGRQHDPEAVAGAAAHAIARHKHWPHVVVALPGPDGFWRFFGKTAAPTDRRLPLGGGVVGRAFSTGLTQHVTDVSGDPDYVPAGTVALSELAVPLRVAGGVVGVLNIESDRPLALGPAGVRLAEALAEAIALGIENARLDRAVAGQAARLEAVVQSSRDGLVLVGEDDRLLLVSAPAARLLGLGAAAGAWFGRSLAELAAALPQPDGRRSVLGAGEAGELGVGGAVLGWSAAPVAGVGRLIVLRDVTEERRTDELRADITRMMVHDLRSPLSSVGGALEILTECAADLREGRRDLPALALATTRRLEGLVNAILDVGRLEGGRMPVRREPTSLADLVRQAIDAQRLLADSRGLRLDHEGDGAEALPLVSVDGELVGRILQNLIGNSIKFIPRGGRIAVRTRAAAHDPTAVQVTVRDDGPGLPAEMEGRLFQKFASGRQKERGSGLGLAFCRLAAEAHGGRIWAENDGSGAVFHFTLPVAVSSEGTGEPAPAAPSRAANRTLRVLVVDDEAINRKVAAIALRRLGHTVGEAVDGLDALEALRAEPYDVVLMDLEMPRLHGLEAARRIRDEWQPDSRPRVIALTASARREDREGCLAAGMEDYLTKPLRMAALEAKLGRARAEEADTGTSNLPALDPEQMAELRSLDRTMAPGLLAELMEAFYRQAPERITALRAAVERGDAATLNRLAHGLKGAGGTVGARGLAVLCAELERADCAKDAAGALQLVAAIQREFDRVLEALRAEGLGEVASRIRAEAAGS